MPLGSINIQPGVNSQLTQTANKSQWWATNLVRWQNGLLQKLAGWQRLISTQAAGLIRALHAYEDLSLTNQMLLGTDGGAQVYNAATGLNTFTFGRTGTDPSTSSITFTNTSASAAVHDTASNVTVGNSVTLNITISGGGHIYLAGTQFVIATKVDADNYTITLPVAATASGVAVVPNVSTAGGFWTLPGTPPLTISLPNHGLIVGGSFSIQFPMSSTNSSSGILYNLPVGSYVVGIVLSPDFFTLLGHTMTATIASPVTDPENGGFIPLVYPSTSQPTSVVNWSMDNLGQIGIISYQNGPIFTFTPPSGVSPTASQIVTAPSINTAVFVAMPQAQIIALGADVSGVQDPMLIRWSDAGDDTNWTADATNQAGSYRLSQGSRIIGGIQAPQTTLVWTDVGLYSLQYIGPPLVYGIYQIGAGCGLIAPLAAAILNQHVYWMGDRQFYEFDGQSMTDLPCSVWDEVFNDIDTAHKSRCFAGANSAFNEVWFYYPSASGGTGEIDSYAKLTVDKSGNLWDTGKLGRTAWMDASVFGNAMAGDLNRRIQQHDVGYDDDGSAMTGVFAESGYVDLDGGDTIMSVNDIEPDMKYFGSVPGAMTVTLRGAMYPQGPFYQKGPYGLDMQNRHIRPRLRARLVALRIDWLARLGFSARVGAWKVRSEPSGKRP